MVFPIEAGAWLSFSTFEWGNRALRGNRVKGQLMLIPCYFGDVDSGSERLERLRPNSSGPPEIRELEARVVRVI